KMKSSAVLNKSPLASAAREDHSLSEVQRFVSRPQFAVRHTVTAGGCEFQPHTHLTFTVTAVLAGRMETMIGERAYEVSAGEVALTNVGQNHSAHALEVEFVSIGVSPVLVNELVAEIGLMRTSADVVFRGSVITDETITRLARAM